MTDTQASIDNGETFLTDLLSAGELSHFGVLGMHWGVRKSRVDTPNSADHEEVAALRKKKVSQLSNEDLKKANTRRQAEVQYRQLNPTSVDKGKAAAKGIFALAGAGASVGGAVKFYNSKEGKSSIAFGKTLLKNVATTATHHAGLVKFIVTHPVEG